MAARCFGLSIVLWCFWAAFVALMRGGTAQRQMRRQTACLLVYCCRGEVLLPQSWLPKNETGATVLDA